MYVRREKKDFPYYIKLYPPKAGKDIQRNFLCKTQI